jgi:hypothetical protein
MFKPSSSVLVTRDGGREVSDKQQTHPYFDENKYIYDNSSIIIRVFGAGQRPVLPEGRHGGAIEGKGIQRCNRGR